MKKSLLLTILLIVVLAVTVTANAETVKIGLVCPVTGAAAAYGETMINSAKLAVEEINANGGIAGKYPIELIIEDDEGTPAKSVNAAMKLINQDGINVLIGAQASTCTLAVMEVTQSSEIPQFIPASTAITITQQGNEWIFRNAAPDPLQTREVLKYAQEVLGAQKIAILNEATDYGVGGALLLAAYAEEMGMEVTASEQYNTGDTDFSVQLTKIAQDNPDVIAVWGFYSEGALILKQARQYEINATFMGGTGWAAPKLVELAGEAAEGIFFSTPFSPANPAENVQAYVTGYTTANPNSTPDFNGAQTYDSVYIIARAIEECGKTDSKSIRDAVRAFTEPFHGVSGEILFDETGEVVKDLFIVTVQDGAHVVVR